MTEPLGVLPENWESPTSLSSIGGNPLVRNAVFGDDANLFVRFDWHPEVNWFASKEAGHMVIEKKEYVWIQRPGEKNQIVHRKVTKKDLRRFPKHYEAFSSGGAQSMLGIPLKGWEFPLSAPDLATLRLLGIEYVHQLATISDSLAPSIGVQFKEWKAAAQLTMDDFNEKQTKTEMKMLLNESDKKVAAMQDQINQLMSMVGDKANGKAKEEEGYKKLLAEANASTEVTKRKRRTKAEMLAAKGE